jgi:hypothetical protein
MKKLLKIVVVLVLLLVVGVALFAMFFVGPAVRKAANTMGPELLGVPVKMGDTAVLPLRGKVRLAELEIGNPEGFKSEHLFSMDKLSVDVAPATVFSDTIVVKDVTISGVKVIYETTGLRSNLGTLLKSLEKGQGDAEEPAEDSEVKKEDDAAPGKQVIIKRVVLEDLEVKVAATLAAGRGLTLPLSRIELTNLGAKGGGLTAVQATTEIVKAITIGVGKALTENSAKLAKFGVDLTKSVGELGIKGIGAGAQIGAEAAKAVAGGVADGAKVATEVVGDGAKAVTGVVGDGAKAAADGAKAVTGVVGDGAKAVTSGAVDGAKAVTGTVGDGAKAVAGGVTDGAKAVTGAVGGGAKAVTEGAGKLFSGLKKVVPGGGDKDEKAEEKSDEKKE